MNDKLSDWPRLCWRLCAHQVLFDATTAKCNSIVLQSTEYKLYQLCKS